MDMIWIICAIAFFVGVLANELLRHLQKTYGVLRIDHSNPDKDTYRFEIDDIDILQKKKFIVLKVDNNADLSQK